MSRRRRRRREDRKMLAQVSRSPLPFAPDTDNGDASGSAPKTATEKLWMSVLIALMAAVMMVWLGFLGWAAWRLWRLLSF